ncbi:MAG: hypothetical protein U5R48_00445 [Gammaproteobacteria bacterium]|nr:hypothetical protein [Gammaproteobacteria bacterium]
MGRIGTIPGGAVFMLVVVILALTGWFLGDVRLAGVGARLDVDDSGVLERDEVGPLAARAFARVDRDGSGGIDGVEFRRWILGQWLSGRTGPVTCGTPADGGRRRDPGALGGAAGDGRRARRCCADRAPGRQGGVPPRCRRPDPEAARSPGCRRASG